MVFSIIVLKCCWGPTTYQVMSNSQIDNSVLKVLNASYAINELNGEDVSNFNLIISFNDSTKQVSGFSGCNRFFGLFTLENNNIKFKNLSLTKMFCNETSNHMEQKLLQTFNNAHLVLFSNDGFSLFNKKKVLLATSKKIDKIYSIEYTASSRGVYKQVIINEKNILKITKRDGKPISKNCSSEAWEHILTTMKFIEIKNIPKLEPPSKNFQFDGAAMAHLKIIKGNEIYESAPFDHENPPEKIAELVKEILSISENME